MKIGVVGNGMIVNQMLKDMEEVEQISVTSICVREKSEEKGRRIAEEYGLSLYTDYERFLREGDFDAVYVGIVNSGHYRYAREALEAGKHVICEKPFTVNAGEARELFGLAKEKDLFLWEACKVPYSPVFAAIRDNLSRIGRVKLIQCNFSKLSSRFRQYEKGEVLPAFDPNLAGGCLMDINLYNIHFTASLFGRPKEVRYFANKGFNGIDTSGVAVLSYEDFQAVCTGAKDSGSPCFGMIQGTEGCIRVEGPVSNLLRAEILDKEGWRLLAEDQEGESLRGEFKEFERQYRERDYKACKEQMEKSILAMEIVEEARKGAGIRFSEENGR